MSVSVLSAFSTCRAQSAHVMPVTERVCSFMMFLANRGVPLRFRAERHTVESIERSYQHRSHGMARSAAIGHHDDQQKHDADDERRCDEGGFIGNQPHQTGRASSREREGEYVKIQVGAGT